MRARGGVCLVLILLACRSDRAPGTDGLAAGLIRAAPPRLVEARLAHGAAYRPCDGSHLESGRCAPVWAPGTREFTRLAQATERVREARSSGVASGHVEGLTELAWLGVSATSLGRAAGTLERALATDPVDWRLLNDLAAVYLARARAEDQPLDHLRALELLERVEGEPAAAVLFNRAVALEALGLWGPAEETWTRFLEREPTSGWADEARARREDARMVLREISVDPADAIGEAWARRDSAALTRLAGAHPQPAREVSLQRLLPDALDGGPDSLLARLPLLRALGAALVDRSVADIVEDLERAVASGDGGELEVLGEALRSFAEGSRLWIERQNDAAILRFGTVLALSGDQSPSLSAWAALETGSSHMLQFRYADAAPWFDHFLQNGDETRHPSQVGRAVWGKGLIAAREGRPEESWGLFLRSAELFGRAGERENEALMFSFTAEMLGQLGRDREAWSPRLRAVAALARARPSGRLHQALWMASDAAMTEGMLRGALILQDVGVGVARSVGEPWALEEALVHRSGIRRALDDPTGAAGDLVEARRIAVTIGDPETRERSLTSIREEEARLVLEEDPRAAAARVDSALAYHQQRGNVINMAQALVTRAQAHAALGRAAQAAVDLARAVEVIERQRATITDQVRGASFGEAWQGIFDAAIGFHVRKGNDPWVALDYAERSRGLFVRPPENHLSVTWAAETSGFRVPSGTALIQFFVVDGTVLRWTVESHGRSFDRLDVDAAAFSTLASEFVDGLKRGAWIEELAAELGRVLLPSWLDSEKVVIVPDRFLNGLPFHALADPRSDRPLVETTTVAVSPSFGFHVSRAVLGRTKREPSESALLVGNPDLSSDADPLFVNLPGAEREVGALRALYPASRVLLGTSATRSAFLAELDEHPVVHYSGHAVFDEAFPEASFFPLASGNSRTSDRLYVRELIGISFERLRTVVLSACSSVAPTEGRGGGLWGLAFPFLDGGVTAVVGSLWPIDDSAAEALVVAFHDALQRGIDPAAALGEAQRALIVSGDPRLASPRAWAAFQVLGT